MSLVGARNKEEEPILWYNTMPYEYGYGTQEKTGTLVKHSTVGTCLPGRGKSAPFPPGPTPACRKPAVA